MSLLAQVSSKIICRSLHKQAELKICDTAEVLGARWFAILITLWSIKNSHTKSPNNYASASSLVEVVRNLQ